MSSDISGIEKIYEDLRKKLLCYLPNPGSFVTPFPGVVVNRRDEVNKPENCFNKPILAVTLQGYKRTVVGSKEFRYGAGHSLLAGVDLPNLSYMTEASREKPYLVITLELDKHYISQLALKISSIKKTSMKGATVIQTDPDIIRAFSRLFDLLDTPKDIPLFSPLIIKEIYVLLLLGAQGDLLYSLNMQGTKSNQVYQSINWLRENFMQPLDVDRLASIVAMAPSTFRKHFKTITTMSPTQYHKQLRLYEAQRLMLENTLDASHAAYAVGYESLTQFNREYKRLFGKPPHKSVLLLSPTKNTTS